MNIPSSLIRAGRSGLALFAFCALLASAAHATISLGDSQVQIGGFFSQGYLYSNNNNYPTADKGGTWDFREMAFNASTTVGGHLRVGAQVFAETLGNLGNDKAILDWAVADYNFSPLFGIRAGRVKYPKGLYGEALDLDVVRPFVFLPSSVYSSILRDFNASFDGAMAYGSVNVGRSSIDYKLFYGSIPMSPQKGVAEFYNNSGLYTSTGATKLQMDAVEGGQLTWNTPVNGLKFVYSYSFATNLASDGPFAAYPAADLHSNFDRFSWTTLSSEYAVGDWTFASEWQRNGGTISYGAAPVLPITSGPSGWDGWYVSAARRLNDKFELGAYFGKLKERFTSIPSSDPRSHQNDSALSFRCDITEHIIFKLEAHYIDGLYQTFNTVRIPNPTAGEKSETMMFAAKTTLSF